MIHPSWLFRPEPESVANDWLLTEAANFQHAITFFGGPFYEHSDVTIQQWFQEDATLNNDMPRLALHNCGSIHRTGWHRGKGLCVSDI